MYILFISTKIYTFGDHQVPMMVASDNHARNHCQKQNNTAKSNCCNLRHCIHTQSIVCKFHL